MMMTNGEMPLRTFTVYYSTALSYESFEAHIPQLLPDGALQFITYVGNTPYTSRLFASGLWVFVAATLPDPAALAEIEARLLREKQELMAERELADASTSLTKH